MHILKKTLLNKYIYIILIVTAVFSNVNATNYYLLSGGTLTSTSSWGLNTDGTGTHPANFTAASQVFYIHNNSSVTLGSAWTVSGSGSKVVLGDGTNAITLTMSSTLTGTIDVSDNATLSIGVTTIPTLGTIGSTNTTVDYSASGNQTITAKTYVNLTTSGSGTKTLAGTTVVNGVLTLNAALSAVAKNLTFTNDIAGTKTLLAVSTGTTLIINGTTAVTLPSNMTGIGPLTINNSAGVSMAANLKLTSALTLTSGDFNIGSHELEFSSTSANITGTVTNLKSTQYSSIRFTATSSGLTIPSSVADLKCLYVGSTNTLASNLNIHDSLSLYLSGTFNNGAYLTMKTGSMIQKTVNTALLQAEPNAQSSYNVKYTGSIGYFNGNELPSDTTKLNNLIIEKTGNMQLTKSITVNGHVIINSGTLQLGANDMKIRKNFYNNATSTNFSVSSGEVEFAGNDTVFTTDENIFYDIKISGTLTVPSNYAIVFKGNFVNNGTFNHRNSTVKIGANSSGYGIKGSSTTTFNHIETLIGAYFPGASSKDFKIAGNLKPYYDNGLTTSSCSVTFTGDSLQTISCTTGDALNFNFKVVLDKTSGKKVQLNTPVNILDSLVLTSGKILTDTVNVLSFKAGSVCVKNSDSSYVHGPVIKIGNTAFDFPLQKALSISASAVGSDSWRAQYFGTNQTQGATLASTLTNLNNCEHWKLTRKVGSSSVIVGLNWDTTSCLISSNIENMRVARYTGGVWTNLGNDTYTGNNVKGNVKGVTASNGGYYTLAQSATGFTKYYLVSGGTITSTASWGTNTNGTGTNPTNFTADDQLFNVVNNTTLTLGSAWSVSGLSSRVIIGDGTNAITLTQNADITTVPVDIKANAILKVNYACTNLLLGKLDIASTVDYSRAGNQTTFGATYGNFTTSGSGVKSMSGTITVNGTLTLGAQLTLASPYNPFTFTNDIAGTKTYLVSNSNIDMKIKGTSAVTLPSNFTSANELEINNTGGVTMTTSLTLTDMIFTAGDFNIGANTLTFSGFFYGTSTNLKSTSSSNISIKTTSAFSLPTSITSLNNLDMTMVSVGSTASLAASVNIYGTFTIGKGNLINSSYINMRPNTNVIYKSGTIDGELNAVNYYNLTYETVGAGTTTTGYELPATTTLLKNLTINSDNTGRRITLNKNVKVNGNITITQGILNLSTYTVSLKGNFTNAMTNAGFEAGTSTVNFVGNTTITTTDENEFNNVTITDTLTAPATYALKVKGNMVNNGLFNHNSSTVKFSGTTTLSGSSTTQFNNLTINASSALTLGTGLTEIKIDGNFSNSGTFTHNNKKLSFEGAGLQTITSTSALTLYDLAIKKSTNNLQLLSPVALSNVLTFIGGALITDSTNILTFNAGSSYSGMTANRYIAGPVRKKGNTAFTFPLVKPLAISATTNSANEFYIKYVSGDIYPGAALEDSIGSVSNCEYWQLHSTTSDSAIITASWTSTSCDIDTSSILIAYYESGTWKYGGKIDLIGDNTSGSVSSNKKIKLGPIMIIKHGKEVIPNLNTGFVELKSRLDGSYHTCDGPTLRIKYNEEYLSNEHELSFIIYYSDRTVALSNSTLKYPVVYKSNWFEIPVSGLPAKGTYVLEVKNKKNELSYLRIKYNRPTGPDPVDHPE